MFNQIITFIKRSSSVLSLVLVVVTFVITIVNSGAIIRTNGRLDSIVKVVNEQNSLIIKQNKDISRSLDTINAHLELLDKYASKDWGYFYGDTDIYGDVNIKNKKTK